MKLTSDDFIVSTRNLVIGYDEPLISNLNLKLAPGRILSLLDRLELGKRPYLEL